MKKKRLTDGISDIWKKKIFDVSFQASAEGYLPQEVEFIVIDSHPTLLNVTLHSAKVAIQEKYFIDSVLETCKYCTYNILRWLIQNYILDGKGYLFVYVGWLFNLQPIFFSRQYVLFKLLYLNKKMVS